jgi:4-amino-4-deoxy-L-arabinose transferase-like glycosyltransferase
MEMLMTDATSRTDLIGQPVTASQPERHRWYLAVVIVLLLLAAFFRLWELGSVPPGMHSEELTNAQISDRVRGGEISVIYDEVQPGREGLYYALLAATTTVIGRGLILWRLPSVWMAMLSVAITAQLLRRLYGVRVSLFAVGLIAIAFWPVWMGRAVQHVALLPLMTTGSIYALVRAFEARRQATASLWFTLGGLALGAAQYVHVTAWTLFLLYVLFIGYYWMVDRQTIHRHRANILFALLLALTLCIPLFIYMAQHPGVREPVPVSDQPRLLAEIPGRLATALASLALRGDMIPQHNLPGRPIFGPVLAVLAVSGIGVALARWRQPTFGLALLWLVVGMLPTAFLPQQPDFEFMAVILPIIFVFPALGLRAVYGLAQRFRQGRLQAYASAAVTLIVAVLLIANALATFRDYFREWPALGDVRLNYGADLGILAHYLDTQQEDIPISICSTPVESGAPAFSLNNEELLSYLMHRHSLSVRYFDCSQSLVLANGAEDQLLIFPSGHYYDRLPGQLLGWMRFAQDEQVPGIRPDVVMSLNASEELAAFAGAFTTEALAAWPPPPESRLEGIAELPVQFGYNITFLGYDLRDDRVRPGDWIEVTTYWRVDGPPPPSLVVFVHLLSNPVVVVAQTDGLGVETGTLEVRDVFAQNTLIKVPDTLSAGTYPLSVGLYFPDTRERLMAFRDGAAIADRLFLRSVTISP